jgi:hypothetical protein
MDCLKCDHIKMLITLSRFYCIDPQSISPTFYKQLLCQYSFDKKLQSQTTVSREKLQKTLSYEKDEKDAHKMLMKLTLYL